MRQFYFILLSYLTLFFATAASAQSAKPADVLVVIDTVRANVEKLYEASLKEVPSAPRLSLTLRRPRHVYRKANEVFLKVQVLRQLNGLKRNSPPIPPTSEITPGNVRDLVSAVAADVNELLPVYWAKASTDEPDKKDGVTPTDVYQGLNQLSFLIDGLGIPGVVPNDVHSVARLVHLDMREIYQVKKNVVFEDAGLTPATGKSPADVYNKAFELMESIRVYTLADEASAIPGGVTLPNKDTGAIKPANVMELTNNILAELGSLKIVSGVPATTPQEIHSSGMTPSNVFDELAQAQVILEALQ